MNSRDFSISKEIAKMIGDREFTIEIGIADNFSKGDRNQDRDCDLDF